MAADSRYIYAIVAESRPAKFDFSGVGGAEVYTVPCQDLAAVVSDTRSTEIDPTRQNVLAHTVVQDRLLRLGSLLPMQFGMVAGSRDAVVKLLEKNYPALTGEMARLSGKVEVELKVLWDGDALKKELEDRSDELTRLKAKISSAPSTAEAQGLLAEAGRLVERLASEWKAKYADAVYAVLMGQSHDARMNRPMGVKNILNASFLIDRARENDFQAEVYRLDARYRGRVNFRYVAPLPPYNFVNLRLEHVA